MFPNTRAEAAIHERQARSSSGVSHRTGSSEVVVVAGVPAPGWPPWDGLGTDGSTDEGATTERIAPRRGCFKVKEPIWFNLDVVSRSRSWGQDLE